MNAAFSPMRRVSSTTHVVALGQSAGRSRGRTKDDQEAFFCTLSRSHLPRV
jgi:hypothetical protein